MRGEGGVQGWVTLGLSPSRVTLQALLLRIRWNLEPLSGRHRGRNSSAVEACPLPSVVEKLVLPVAPAVTAVGEVLSGSSF